MYFECGKINKLFLNDYLPEGAGQNCFWPAPYFDCYGIPLDEYIPQDKQDSEYPHGGADLFYFA